MAFPLSMRSRLNQKPDAITLDSLQTAMRGRWVVILGLLLISSVSWAQSQTQSAIPLQTPPQIQSPATTTPQALTTPAQQSSAQATLTAPAVDFTKGLTVSEPVTHKNLSVYFLHRQDRDDREFITLNEGLKSGLVTVKEQQQEQVQQLLIDNKSNKPLFLQEGDRVTGGKQDRTIYSSLVVKAMSGPMPIPTFCVEQSRWQTGSLGKNFTANQNTALASNAVRQASKLSKNQGKVWKEVAKSKDQLQKAVGNKNDTSSLNEALDSKQAIQSTKAYISALGKAAEKHQDLVGVAFAVNGQIMEINMYPGNPLVKSVYPRLLETYALDAVVDQSKTKDGSNPTPTTAVAVPNKEQVLELMKASATKKIRNENINRFNTLAIDSLEKSSSDKKSTLFRCETEFDQKRVHTQWMFSQSDAGQNPGNGANYNVRGNLPNEVDISPAAMGSRTPLPVPVQQANPNLTLPAQQQVFPPGGFAPRQKK